MLVERIHHDKKFIVELWDDESDEFLVQEGFKEPFAEEFYVMVNNWCIRSLGYHARTAYNRFEFKKEKELTLFTLKWS